MEGIQGDDPIESKAITITQPDDGLQFPMILTVFDEDDNETLDRSGFRGRYMFTTIIEGGIQDCFYNVRDCEMHIVNDDTKHFLRGIKRGWETYGQKGIDWSDLDHGKVYEPSELAELM